MPGYTFAARSGLSAQELFFWIVVDETLRTAGVDDIVAVAAIVSGQPTIQTRGKRRRHAGTSPASSFLARNLNVTLPFRLPTLTGASLSTLRVSMTRNLGRFAGRAVPVVGWLYLAYDVTRIVTDSVMRYNRLANAEDRLW